MMSTATDATDYAAIDQLNTEISALHIGLRRWISIETTHSNRAEELRAAADGIETHSAPLHDLFRPIWHFHTAHTWEGSAATQSRERLGIQEERVADVITALDRLVMDLDAEAVIEDGLAAGARDRIGTYRSEISTANSELDQLQP